MPNKKGCAVVWIFRRYAPSDSGDMHPLVELSFWQNYFFFLKLSPFLNSILCDVWIILSKKASAIVSSENKSNQFAGGNWLLMMVDLRACLSSMISIKSNCCWWSIDPKPKSSTMSKVSGLSWAYCKAPMKGRPLPEKKYGTKKDKPAIVPKRSVFPHGGIFPQRVKWCWILPFKKHDRMAILQMETTLPWCAPWKKGLG